MKKTKSFLSSLIVICISITLLSCQHEPNEIASTIPEGTAIVTTKKPSITPLQTMVKAEVTLYSNFDPNHEHDFTQESLVNLSNTQAFIDFDRGEITNFSSADLYLNVSCGTDCFNDFIDINGAKSVEIGKIEPGFQGCLDALRGETKLWASIVPETYSCIHTNSGNIVQILVLENEALPQNAELVLQYILWHQDQ